MQREDVRHVRAIGLVRSTRRLTFLTMAPIEEHAGGLVAQATDIIPAKGSVAFVPAFAVPAEAAAANVADIVFARPPRLRALGDAERVAGPFHGVFRRRN